MHSEYLDRWNGEEWEDDTDEAASGRDSLPAGFGEEPLVSVSTNCVNSVSHERATVQSGMRVTT